GGLKLLDLAHHRRDVSELRAGTRGRDDPGRGARCDDRAGEQHRRAVADARVEPHRVDGLRDGNGLTGQRGLVALEADRLHPPQIRRHAIPGADTRSPGTSDSASTTAHSPSRRACASRESIERMLSSACSARPSWMNPTVATARAAAAITAKFTQSPARAFRTAAVSRI